MSFISCSQRPAWGVKGRLLSQLGAGTFESVISTTASSPLPFFLLPGRFAPRILLHCLPSDTRHCRSQRRELRLGKDGPRPGAEEPAHPPRPHPCVTHSPAALRSLQQGWRWLALGEAAMAQKLHLSPLRPRIPRPRDPWTRGALSPATSLSGSRLSRKLQEGGGR